jgi:integrase
VNKGSLSPDGRPPYFGRNFGRILFGFLEAFQGASRRMRDEALGEGRRDRGHRSPGCGPRTRGRDTEAGRTNVRAMARPPRAAGRQVGTSRRLRIQRLREWLRKRREESDHEFPPLAPTDNGLLAPELANGITRVKGVASKGVRLGNWLTAKQAQALLNAPDTAIVKGLRDRAILAVLLGCGLRRSEAAALTFKHIQQRDGRWCIVDLVGKHGRVRTVPMPTWAKAGIDAWAVAVGITAGPIFRSVNRGSQVRETALSEKVVWQLIRPYAEAAGVPGIAPHDCRKTCAKLCRAAGGELEQIQMLLGHQSVQTTERYLGTKQDLVNAPNDAIKVRVAL